VCDHKIRRNALPEWRSQLRRYVRTSSCLITVVQRTRESKMRFRFGVANRTTSSKWQSQRLCTSSHVFAVFGWGALFRELLLEVDIPTSQPYATVRSTPSLFA
jgi:hypothetical protein